MSADVWLEPEPEDCTSCGLSTTIPFRASFEWDGHSLNLTYNLTPMLTAAGFPGWKALEGAPCSEAGGMLRKVAETLAADRRKFEAYNPDNGWGNYEQAVAAMFALTLMCETHPECHFGAWL